MISIFIKFLFIGLEMWNNSGRSDPMWSPKEINNDCHSNKANVTDTF